MQQNIPKIPGLAWKNPAQKNPLKKISDPVPYNKNGMNSKHKISGGRNLR